MNRHGIIYDASSTKYQAPSLGKRIIYRSLRGFGAGLVSFAIVGVIFSFWPIAKEEYEYKFGSKDQVKVSGFGQILSKPSAEEFGLDPYFSLYIPKINAKSKVIPNVDAGSPKEYLWALSEGVAHARGTNFPGQGKTVYLFSHSTDSPLNFAQYNAVFYLLRKLEKGDRIIVYFMGEKYEYKVTEKLITSGADTSWLTDDGNGERLILQTCDPPGTSLRRLIVIAAPHS